MKTIADLHKAIEKTKGKDIHQKLRGLDATKMILNRNYFWLLQLNKYFLSHIAEISDLRNRDKMDDFQIEFARHLHNYLASVKSLIDHTRTLKKRLKLDINFETKYEKQRKVLLGTDTIAFIQQLREYAQHYELPPSGVEFLVNRDGEKITLILSTKILEEFSDWKPASIRVLQSNPQKIDIFKLLEEYQVAVGTFYEWFYEEVEKIFKAELREFDEIAREYKAYYKKFIQDKKID